MAKPDELQKELKTLTQTSGQVGGGFTDTRQNFQSQLKRFRSDIASIIYQQNIIDYNIHKSLIGGPVWGLDAGRRNVLDYGLDGETLVTYQFAEASSDNCYWNAPLGKPATVKETIDCILAEIAELENKINEQQEQDEVDLSDLEECCNCNQLNTEQLMQDVMGGSYTVNCDGQPITNWSLWTIVSALGKNFDGWSGYGLDSYATPHVNEDTAPTLSLSVYLSKVIIDTTLPLTVIDGLGDMINCTRSAIGMSEGTYTLDSDPTSTTFGMLIPDVTSWTDQCENIWSDQVPTPGAITTGADPNNVVSDGDSIREAIKALDAAVSTDVFTEISSGSNGVWASWDGLGFNSSDVSEIRFIAGDYTLVETAIQNGISAGNEDVMKVSVWGLALQDIYNMRYLSGGILQIDPTSHNKYTTPITVMSDYRIDDPINKPFNYPIFRVTQPGEKPATYNQVKPGMTVDTPTSELDTVMVPYGPAEDWFNVGSHWLSGKDENLFGINPFQLGPTVHLHRSALYFSPWQVAGQLQAPTTSGAISVSPHINSGIGADYDQVINPTSADATPEGVIFMADEGHTFFDIEGNMAEYGHIYYRMPGNGDIYDLLCCDGIPEKPTGGGKPVTLQSAYDTHLHFDARPDGGQIILDNRYNEPAVRIIEPPIEMKGLRNLGPNWMQPECYDNPSYYHPYFIVQSSNISGSTVDKVTGKEVPTIDLEHSFAVLARNQQCFRITSPQPKVSPGDNPDPGTKDGLVFDPNDWEKLSKDELRQYREEEWFRYWNQLGMSVTNVAYNQDANGLVTRTTTLTPHSVFEGWPAGNAQPHILTLENSNQRGVFTSVQNGVDDHTVTLDAEFLNLGGYTTTNQSGSNDVMSVDIAVTGYTANVTVSIPNAAALGIDHWGWKIHNGAWTNNPVATTNIAIADMNAGVNHLFFQAYDAQGAAIDQAIHINTDVPGGIDAIVDLEWTFNGVNGSSGIFPAANGMNPAIINIALNQVEGDYAVTLTARTGQGNIVGEVLTGSLIVSNAGSPNNQDNLTDYETFWLTHVTPQLNAPITIVDVMDGGDYSVNLSDVVTAQWTHGESVYDMYGMPFRNKGVALPLSGSMYRGGYTDSNNMYQFPQFYRVFSEEENFSTVASGYNPFSSNKLMGPAELTVDHILNNPLKYPLFTAGSDRVIVLTSGEASEGAVTLFSGTWYWLDSDGDGIVDAVDMGGDGTIDGYLIDSDGDGYLDGIDYDGDGTIDLAFGAASGVDVEISTLVSGEVAWGATTDVSVLVGETEVSDSVALSLTHTDSSILFTDTMTVTVIDTLDSLYDSEEWFAGTVETLITGDGAESLLSGSDTATVSVHDPMAATIWRWAGVIDGEYAVHEFGYPDGWGFYPYHTTNIYEYDEATGTWETGERLVADAASYQAKVHFKLTTLEHKDNDGTPHDGVAAFDSLGTIPYVSSESGKYTKVRMTMYLDRSELTHKLDRFSQDARNDPSQPMGYGDWKDPSSFYEVNDRYFSDFTFAVTGPIIRQIVAARLHNANLDGDEDFSVAPEWMPEVGSNWLASSGYTVEDHIEFAYSSPGHPILSSARKITPEDGSTPYWIHTGMSDGDFTWVGDHWQNNKDQIVPAIHVRVKNVQLPAHNSFHLFRSASGIAAGANDPGTSPEAPVELCHIDLWVSSSSFDWYFARGDDDEPEVGESVGWMSVVGGPPRGWIEACDVRFLREYGIRRVDVECGSCLPSTLSSNVNPWSPRGFDWINQWGPNFTECYRPPGEDESGEEMSIATCPPGTGILDMAGKSVPFTGYNIIPDTNRCARWDYARYSSDSYTIDGTPVDITNYTLLHNYDCVFRATGSVYVGPDEDEGVDIDLGELDGGIGSVPDEFIEYSKEVMKKDVVHTWESPLYMNVQPNPCEKSGWPFYIPSTCANEGALFIDNGSAGFPGKICYRAPEDGTVYDLTATGSGGGSAGGCTSSLTQVNAMIGDFEGSVLWDSNTGAEVSAYNWYTSICDGILALAPGTGIKLDVNYPGKPNLFTFNVNEEWLKDKAFEHFTEFPGAPFSKFVFRSDASPVTTETSDLMESGYWQYMTMAQEGAHGAYSGLGDTWSVLWVWGQQVLRRFGVEGDSAWSWRDNVDDMLDTYIPAKSESTSHIGFFKIVSDAIYTYWDDENVPGTSINGRDDWKLKTYGRWGGPGGIGTIGSLGVRKSLDSNWLTVPTNYDPADPGAGYTSSAVVSETTNAHGNQKLKSVLGLAGIKVSDFKAHIPGGLSSNMADYASGHPVSGDVSKEIPGAFQALTIELDANMGNLKGIHLKPALTLPDLAWEGAGSAHEIAPGKILINTGIDGGGNPEFFPGHYSGMNLPHAGGSSSGLVYAGFENDKLDTDFGKQKFRTLVSDSDILTITTTANEVRFDLDPSLDPGSIDSLRELLDVDDAAVPAGDMSATGKVLAYTPAGAEEFSFINNNAYSVISRGISPGSTGSSIAGDPALTPTTANGELRFHAGDYIGLIGADDPGVASDILTIKVNPMPTTFLSDVSSVAATDGQVLAWNAAASQYEAIDLPAGGGASPNLYETFNLVTSGTGSTVSGDAAISATAAGDSLTLQAGDYIGLVGLADPDTIAIKVNSMPIDFLSDVDTTTSAPTSGQALVWDPGVGPSGSWVPGSITDSDDQNLFETFNIATAGGATGGTADSSSGPVAADGSTDVLTLEAGDYIGLITDSIADSIEIKLNAPPIDFLSDVSTTAPADGEVLAWDSAASEYVPTAMAGGSAPDPEPSFDIRSSNFTAVGGKRYGVDTSSGTLTITLPSGASAGTAIYFADAGGSYSSNNLTITPAAGDTIMGDSSGLTVSTNNQSFGLFKVGTNWRVY